MTTTKVLSICLMKEKIIQRHMGLCVSIKHLIIKIPFYHKCHNVIRESISAAFLHSVTTKSIPSFAMLYIIHRIIRSAFTVITFPCFINFPKSSVLHSLFNFELNCPMVEVILFSKLLALYTSYTFLSLLKSHVDITTSFSSS